MKISRGFSLVEVLVALGILGVVSMAMMSTVSQLLSNQQTIETRQNIQSLIGDIQALTSNGSTCLNLFGGGNQTFDYRAAQTAAGAEVSINLNGENLTKDSNSSRFNLRVANLTLNNATAVGTDGTLSVYLAQVMGSFKPPSSVQPGKISGLSDFKPRQLGSIFFSTNASNQIVACQNHSPLEANLLSELCASMGGTYNGSTKKCEGLITVAQICEAVGGTLKNGNCDLPNSNSGSSQDLRWVSNGGILGYCQAHGANGQYAGCLLGSRCSKRGQICAYQAAIYSCRHICQ